MRDHAHGFRIVGAVDQVRGAKERVRGNGDSPNTEQRHHAGHQVGAIVHAQHDPIAQGDAKLLEAVG